MNERETWLQRRRDAVGASEVAALLGIEGAWGTPMDVYNSKVLGIEQEDTPQMMMGREIEASIAKLYAEETGRTIHVPEPYQILRHESAPLAATLDRLVVVPWTGPLQLKSVGMSLAREWGDEPPLHYAVQVQAEMACSAHKRGALAGWVGGQNLVHYDLVVDPEFQKVMLEEVECFWREHVEARVPPEPTAKDSKALQRLYPKDEGVTIALDGTALAMADEVAELKARIGAQTERKAELENRLKATLGAATWGVLPDGSRMQWKLEHRKEHLVKASSTRVLRRIKARGRKR
jgi:putative phage-type endonuclease